MIHVRWNDATCTKMIRKSVDTNSRTGVPGVLHEARLCASCLLQRSSRLRLAASVPQPPKRDGQPHAQCGGAPNDGDNSVRADERAAEAAAPNNTGGADAAALANATRVGGELNTRSRTDSYTIRVHATIRCRYAKSGEQ